MSIPIVYVFDENYAAYSCVSAISACRKATEDIVFHVITDHTDDKAEQIFVKELNAHGQTVKTYKANLGFDFVEGRISRSAYLKLSIPGLIEEKKILYVDGDTIFQDCPSKAFKVDLEDKVIGAVCDYSHFPRQRSQWESKIIPFKDKNETYMNSGMMIWNLERLENENLIVNCKKIEQDYPDKIRYNDQDLLNKVFEGKKKIVDYKFNHQIWNGIISKSKWEEISDPDYKGVNLFHFIGKYKPWKKCCNPLIKNYWRTFASQLKTIKIQMQPLENFRQKRHFARMLHLSERYQEASKLREELIDIMDKRFKKVQKNNLDE